MPEAQNVLVVDESPEYRALVSAVLSTQGYNVAQADDASSAIEQLGKREFSAVILDLKMPHNGVALIDYLGDTMPQVLLRTIAFVPWVDRPIWAVLPKPFKVDELVRSVAECCAQT